MDVPYDVLRSLQFDDVGFLEEEFFCLLADPLDFLFGRQL